MSDSAVDKIAALERQVGYLEQQLDGVTARFLNQAETITELTQRVEQAVRERDEALAAVVEEQRLADERRTELLEERDEALGALADADAVIGRTNAEVVELAEWAHRGLRGDALHHVLSVIMRVRDCVDPDRTLHSAREDDGVPLEPRRRTEQDGGPPNDAYMAGDYPKGM